MLTAMFWILINGDINMRVTQKRSIFTPIFIVLETAEEAENFIDIIDDIEQIDGQPDFTEGQRALIRQISNAFTNQEVIY